MKEVNMKVIAILVFIFTNIVTSVQAEEVEPKTMTVEKPPAKTKTLTIESKVTGSQEQPKVLYIMPWQGIANPITIKDKKLQLAMPEFKPINPKVFRKEVRDFTATQVVLAPKENEQNN